MSEQPSLLRQAPLPCFDSTCQHTWQPQVGHAKGYHATTMSRGPVLPAVPVLVPTSRICTHAHVHASAATCATANVNHLSNMHHQHSVHPTSSRFLCHAQVPTSFLNTDGVARFSHSHLILLAQHLRPHESIYSNIAPPLKTAISGLFGLLLSGP